MNIYIYSDESGVFDPIHNDYFVFGGLMFFDVENKNIASRKYRRAENTIRSSENISNNNEVKAALISKKAKGKLYRSLNAFHKFGVVVDQSKILPQISQSKKSRQRYMDWAYKMAVKEKLLSLSRLGVVDLSSVERIYCRVDEHSTATDGKYELRESMEQEFKIGVFTHNFTVYHPPICPNLISLEVEFCNSESNTLVRAADIVANRLYFMAARGNPMQLQSDMFSIYTHP